jgi:hypothetical protein
LCSPENEKQALSNNIFDGKTISSIYEIRLTSGLDQVYEGCGPGKYYIQ